MSVDHGVDAHPAQPGDERLDFLDIGLVIFAFLVFDSLPHHPESDKIKSPSLQISDISVSQR